MGEKVDLTNFEQGVGTLAAKLQLPPGPDGNPMPPQQKQMLIMQFITFGLMS